MKPASAEKKARTARHAPASGETPASRTGRSPVVQLKPKEDRRLRRGHLWVFSNEVASHPPELEPGGLVHFHTAREEFLGVGFYNPHSLIAGRLLDRHLIEPDAAFFENRLRRALELRETVYGGGAYRWVFGESDDLPGLVIDRYGDACVIESYCAGMDRLMPAILAAVKAIHPWKAVVLRNDAEARKLEHLEQTISVAEGEVAAPLWFDVDGLKIAADPMQGQKTGFFFDQRDNRRTVAAVCAGKTVLDVFCHTGGFGLWAAKAGAKEVLGVDSSEPALAMARAAAEANGFAETMRFEKAEAFPWLGAAKEKFDVVVLDPPRFVPTKKQLATGIEAYVRLNALALRSVRGGGYLATSSCSQHVDRDTFRQILSRAVHLSGRRARLLHWGGQAKDHPVRLSMPETEYLKFALLHVS